MRPALTVALLLAAGAALAQTGPNIPPAAGSGQPTAPQLGGTSALEVSRMSEADIRAKLQAQGYQEITDLKLHDNNSYSATALRDGQMVQLQVDAQTGQVTGR
jgi:hypothetical protein